MVKRANREVRQPEQWRPVPGYEGVYEVSSLGRVKSCFRWIECKGGFRMSKPERILRAHAINGYLAVKLVRDGRSKGHYVHNLVAYAFLGPRPEGMHAAHNDGSRTKNVPSNLRYCTPAENNADKLKHGTHQTGELHGRAIVDSPKVREIRELAERGVRTAEIARRFGIGWTTAYHIIKRNTWRGVA